jgi:hypothetical protein
VFGAIVLAVGGVPGAAAQYSVEGFARVFVAAAGSFAIALTAVMLLKEKPLLTVHA